MSMVERILSHLDRLTDNSEPKVYCDPDIPYSTHLVIYRDPANERRTLAIRNSACLGAWEKLRAHGEYMGFVPERWHREPKMPS